MSRIHWPVFAILALATQVAWAEEGDDLKLVASTGFRHDSNLFRLSSSANVQGLIGRSAAAETINTNALGLRYKKAYSLQSVDLSVDIINNRYQNFSYLNFSALNYSGKWNWSYTPHLYGNLTVSRQQSLNSFADFQGFNQRNERVDTNKRLDATYELGARWRLLGTLAQYGQTNRQPLIAESGSRQTETDAGVRYELPSGSSASFIFKNSDGRYTDVPLSVPNLFDNKFTQSDNELDLIWAISAKTSANIRVGYTSRSHPNFPQRNFSGPMGSATLNWAITAKSALTAAWRHDLVAYQTANTNFSRNDRFSIGPVWSIGPKTSLSLQMGNTIRNFGGSPSGTAQSQRRDVNRDASLTFDWQPRRWVDLNASVQNERRSSSLPGLDYNSNIVNLTALFTF